MPSFIPRELATLRTNIPPGDAWIHEIKFDDYRLQAHRLCSEATLYTRSGLNWTKRFPTIASVVSKLPAERPILDGEVIVERDGRPNFSELQADLANNRYDRMTYYTFDILYLDGFDLRPAPLIERKRVLAGLLNEASLGGPLIYSNILKPTARRYSNIATD